MAGNVLAFSGTGLITGSNKALPPLEEKAQAPLSPVSSVDITNSLRLTLPAGFLNNKLGDFINADGVAHGANTIDPAHDGDWTNTSFTLDAAEIGNNTVAGTMDIAPVVAQYNNFKQEVVNALNAPATSIIDFTAFLNDTLVNAEVKNAISNGTGQIQIANVNESLRRAVAQDVGIRDGSKKVSDGFLAGDTIFVEGGDAGGGFTMGFTLAAFTDNFTDVHDHSFAAADNTAVGSSFTAPTPISLTITLT